MEYSKHFQEMIKERSINISWVEQTLEKPDTVDNQNDGTRHFIRQIPENENRWLRVIVNIKTNPNKAITAFFDRRLRRNK